MLTYVLDQQGKLRSPDDPSLSMQLGVCANARDLMDLAVTRLGYVEVRHRTRYIRVRCRPAVLSKAQHVSLFAILSNEPRRPIALEYLAKDWYLLLLRDPYAFTSFVSSLAVGEAATQPRLLNTRYARHASSFAGRDRIARSAAAAVTDISDLTPIFNALFAGQWTLFELDRATGDSIARVRGSAYPPYNPRWLANPNGQSVRAIANAEYGIWIAKLHREVTDTGAAVYDDVDAVVEFPNVGEARLQYSRATIPVQLQNGRALVISAAESNRLIDLRTPSAMATG